MLRLSVLLLAATLALPASADIRIAVMAPLSGQFQVLGQQMRAGVQKAVDDINARGGVDGEKLVLDVEDDGCKAETAAAAANRAAGRGDVLVIGHVCAAAAEAAAAVYAQNGILFITPGVSADSLTDRRAGPTIFRIATTDRAQGYVAGGYIAKAYPRKRIAVLDDGSPYGKPIADGAAAALKREGVTALRRETYDAGAKDYNALAARLIDDATDVVFLAGYQGDIALIAKALRAANSAMIVMGPDTIGTNQFLDLAGDTAEGLLFTFFTDFRLGDEARDVVAAFRASGTEPVGLVLPSYAALEVWLAARSSAPSKDAASVAATLQDGSFPSVIGKIDFWDNGSTRIPGFSIYRWQDGKPALVE
ncbi:MAG: branched-chain amino acid ABC transporter substrate-binding protein [Rhizobiales bacterium]|nr:branched-chain amino acid ABC transporter substrate-binding protein [Hyphomicrobiales bacterium]